MFPNRVQGQIGSIALHRMQGLVLEEHEAASGLYSASAGAFYAVHASVRGAEDGVDAAAVAWIGGDAGAGAYAQFEVVLQRECGFL